MEEQQVRGQTTKCTETVADTGPLPIPMVEVVVEGDRLTLLLLPHMTQDHLTTIEL